MRSFLKNIFAKQHTFISSVLLGMLLWVMAFLLLPIETSKISNETIAYLASCFTLFIVGFYVFKFKNTTKFFKNSNNSKYFIISIVLLIVAIAIRYIDLFYYRLVSFSFSFIENKKLIRENATKAPLIITLISTLRAMYFLPLLFLVIKKSKHKVNWLLGIVVIIFASVEILLVGTRKPIFHLLLMLFFSIIYTYGIGNFLTKKNIVLSVITLICLGFFSYIILNKRVTENTGSHLGILKVVDSRYNDFVKINKNKLEDLYNNPTSTALKTELLLIHTGQYIVHGVYELDYVIRNDFPKANGMYSFNPIYKLLHRLKLINVKSDQLSKSHPRDYVYLTFFGSLFVDFGWLSLVLAFVFGVFQKLIHQLSEVNLLAKLFWIVLLSINVAMPVFNLLAGSGLYVFLSLCLLLLLSLKFKT
mgnify:CR=1 FL=1